MRKLLILTLTLASPYLAAAGQEITYKVNEAYYHGYYTSTGDKAPFILLLHDWDGLTRYEVRRADMLAALGYSVFAADLFGAGVRPTRDEDKRLHTGELYKDREKMRRLMKAAIEEAKGLGANTDNGVAMGYCFGGAAVLELARSGYPLKAYVTFHGGLGTPEGQDYTATKSPVLVFHGTADSAVPLEDFTALAKQLQAANVDHELTTYGGAPHAFTVFGSTRYDAQADHKSWQRFTQFLSDTLQ